MDCLEVLSWDSVVEFCFSRYSLSEAEMSNDLIHLTGWRQDGTRINRRYKTAEAAQRMASTMSFVNKTLLRAVSLEDLEAALTETETTT